MKINSLKWNRFLYREELAFLGYLEEEIYDRLLIIADIATALLGQRSVRSRSHPWARRPSRWNDPRAWVQDRAAFTDRRRLRSSDDSRAAARSSSPGGNSPRKERTRFSVLYPPLFHSFLLSSFLPVSSGSLL